MKSIWPPLYVMIGSVILLGYLWSGVSGKVIGGTDSREQTFLSDGSSSGSRGGSGWGYTGGYYGGK
jgi:hypothetical protein